MGQIITNTFFDDCEGIKVVAGKACFEVPTTFLRGGKPEGIETLGQLLRYFGLSEEIGKDLKLLCGVYALATDKATTELFFPINVLSGPVGSSSETYVYLESPAFGATSGDIQMYPLFTVLNYLGTPEDERLNCEVI